MSNDMVSTEASSDEKDDSFGSLMHRLESAIHRLKLAAEDLSGLADTMPAEEHGSAAFVVAETTEALNQLYHDLNVWDKAHHCLRRSVTTRWTECSAAAVVSAVTAMNQAVDLDEATRARAMSVVIDALNLAVSRFRKEARQNVQEDH